MDNATLAGMVRRKLNITWEDPDTEARLNEIMESAVPDLIHRLGITDPDFDFSTNGTERTLFLTYCFYEWNHALDEWETNYANMISQTRARHEVAHYREAADEETV